MYQQQANTDKAQWGQHQQHPCGGHWGRKWGGFWGQKNPWMQKFAGHWAGRKAANIAETDAAFTISLYAAGLSKEAFKISVKEDVLQIRYEAPEGQSGEFIHQEYQPVSFERSFQLNGKVLTESISAAYTDGVLTVTLPKNPDTNKPAQDVSVN